MTILRAKKTTEVAWTQEIFIGKRILILSLLIEISCWKDNTDIISLALELFLSALKPEIYI